MQKKLLLLLLSLLSYYLIEAQGTDYSKIKFHSKVFEYKKISPRTKALGIDKEILSNLVGLLGYNIYSEQERKEITNKVWLAFTNPKTFDFVYRDFALKTSKEWQGINAHGELVLEPNPYLTEWTFNDEEMAYFQRSLNKILEFYKLIGFGDDAASVKASFNRLLITKTIDFIDPKDDDWAYSYLETANILLKEKGLVALVTKGDYDIIVCGIAQKDKISQLFKTLDWDFIQP